MSPARAPGTNGRSRHGEGCGCVRCQGFPKGNQLAVRHGARSIITLEPRAREIAEQLRDITPLDADSDTAAIETLGLVLAQAERAALVLALEQGRQLDRLRAGAVVPAAELTALRDLSDRAIRWVNAAHRWSESLGLVTSGRARLGLDLVRARALSARSSEADDDGYDFSKLSPKQMIELEALIEIATGGDDA